MFSLELWSGFSRCVLYQNSLCDNGFVEILDLGRILSLVWAVFDLATAVPAAFVSIAPLSNRTWAWLRVCDVCAPLGLQKILPEYFVLHALWFCISTGCFVELEGETQVVLLWAREGRRRFLARLRHIV